MFPTKFVNDASFHLASHNAITFMSGKSTKETVAHIMRVGISAFFTPDNDTSYSAYSYSKRYNDDRINGGETYVRGASCCAFTKNNSLNQIFPISRKELANVGLVESDLIEWINFLNSTKAGFEYYYFGEQEAPAAFRANGSHPLLGAQRYDTNDMYYWVMFPATPKSNSTNIPYIQWIALRYLFNTTVTSHPNDIKGYNPTQLAYYNIPRITMYLHKELGVPKLKAFLYAHLASRFYSGYGLGYVDLLNRKTGYEKNGNGDLKGSNGYSTFDIYGSTYQQPCVNLTGAQFKAIMASLNCCGNMNNSLTQGVFKCTEAYKKIKGLKNLEAPYDRIELLKLFDKGDYEGFVKHIKDSYRKLNSKKNVVAKTKAKAKA